MASLFPGALRAQSWPTLPIRWVVPYTAGGLTDVVTRLTLEKMNVGQNFVVDNKPGANSLIGRPTPPTRRSTPASSSSTR
jgi:tripartite-type tricarboxylate transporter receptor subunit TctC